jgi:hypothetical protein
MSRPYVPVVLICLLALTPLEGCRWRRSVTTFTYRQLRQIHVAGHVRWSGQVPRPTLRVLATSFPQSIAGTGSYELTLVLPRSRTGSVEYDLGDLDMVTAAEESRRVRSSPLGSWKARPTRHRIFTVKYYVVRVVPPPGWRAIPASREVRTTTEKADFVLTTR